MATIGNTNHAVYLYPHTGTQLIDGNVNGYAALGNGDYFAVYGPGPYAFSIIVTGDIQSGGASSLDGGIVLGGPGIITNQSTIEGGAGILINGYAYGGSSYIKNTGLIEGRTGAGIYTYGRGGVNNLGRIIGGSNGVYLSGGGVVTNAGSISGGTGVGVATYYGAGYVANSGVIRGTTTDGVFALGTVVNQAKGTITGAQVGVNLYAGGTLTNTKGVITGGTAGVGIYGYGNSYYGDAPAAIRNTGTISGGQAGILIGASHSYATSIYNASGASISGSQAGITIAAGSYGASDTDIANAGLITGTAGSGIVLDTGSIINTGTIAGAAGYGIAAYGATSIYNAGQISAAGTAIALAGGGTVIDKGGISGGSAGIVFANGYANQLTLFAGGVIDGAVNLYGTLDLIGTGQAGKLNFSQISNASTIAVGAKSDWTLSGTISGITEVFNSGTVNITGGGGVALNGGLAVYNYGLVKGGITTAGDYVYNSGKIAAGSGSGSGAGILLSAAGYIINAAGGTISGATGVALTKNTSLYNYGLISGVISGVTSTGAAAVYNYAGATIAGSADGVFLKSGTVTDDGVISGATYAVDFGKSAANLLALGSTATLTGGADLGGGGIELLDNTKPGTFTAANYKDFAALTIAATADWDVAGTLAATIAVTNDGTISDKSAGALTINGAFTGTGTVDLPATLTLNGPVSAGQHLAFTGTAQTLNLGDATGFAGKLEKFAAGDTIDLTGIDLASITATHFAGGILTLTEASGSLTLTFTSPKSFGADTFALFADGAGTGITLAAPPAPAITNSNSAGFLSNHLVQTLSSAINLVTLQA